MGKKLVCREQGMDYDFVARSETEGGLIEIVGEHAKNVHGITEIMPELTSKVKATIKDE